MHGYSILYSSEPNLGTIYPNGDVARVSLSVWVCRGRRPAASRPRRPGRALGRDGRPAGGGSASPGGPPAAGGSAGPDGPPAGGGSAGPDGPPAGGGSAGPDDHRADDLSQEEILDLVVEAMLAAGGPGAEDDDLGDGDGVDAGSLAGSLLGTRDWDTGDRGGPAGRRRAGLRPRGIRLRAAP